MPAPSPWDGNLPRLAPVWPLLALCAGVAVAANALLFALAAALAARGVHTVHVALLAGAGAATALVIFVSACVNGAAGRYAGPSMCAAQGGLSMFFGTAYALCLVNQSVRAYRLVVLDRHTTPRQTLALHAVAFTAAAVASALVAGAPGRSVLVASRTYCFPALDDPVSLAAGGVLFFVTGVPLVYAYVRLWRHSRAVAAAARPLRCGGEAQSPLATAAAPAASRVGVRAFVLVAIFFVAYTPYDIMMVVQAATHGPAPEAVDLLGVFAVPVCLAASAALQMRWHTAFRREAVRWAVAAGRRAAAVGCVGAGAWRRGAVAPAPATAAAASARARSPRDAAKIASTSLAPADDDVGGYGYAAELGGSSVTVAFAAARRRGSSRRSGGLTSRVSGGSAREGAAAPVVTTTRTVTSRSIETPPAASLPSPCLPATRTPAVHTDWRETG